jgi:hypothetical protein
MPVPWMHNTSAAAALRNTTGFDVEDLMVDIYYWFDYSTKRKSITRVLKQYASLKSYFISEEHEGHARFQRLKQALSNPMTEVYFLFYQSALQIFINLNLFLQKQDPLIGSISYSLKRFCDSLPVSLFLLKLCQHRMLRSLSMLRRIKMVIAIVARYIVYLFVL